MQPPNKTRHHVVSGDTNYRNGLRTFHQDESAQDLVEYALIVGILGLGAIISLKGVTTSIAKVFTSLATTLTSSV